jgi:hypothetical protein
MESPVLRDTYGQNVTLSPSVVFNPGRAGI